MTAEEPIRLNKHLALELGVSRREADDLIAAGKVLVNDTPAILGARIMPSDRVMVGSKLLSETGVEKQYVAFHKPVGYVCSRRAQGDNPTIYSILPAEFYALKPVGRLDKDSSGLILLTNDGDFAHQMTHPKFYKTKVYEVELDHPLEPLHQQMISDFGVQLPDGPSKFLIMKQDKVAQATDEPQTNRASQGSGDTYEIHMSEGRNRQIRRTFAALGYTVTRLHRIQFGNYSLGDIKSGEYGLTNIH
jgi:23S rRNA pseudouridine2605 synthase